MNGDNSDNFLVGPSKKTNHYGDVQYYLCCQKCPTTTLTLFLVHKIIDTKHKDLASDVSLAFDFEVGLHSCRNIIG